MCRWMGSRFQQSYQNGLAKFRIFGVRKLFISTVSKRTRIFVLQVKSNVFFIQFIKKWVNSFLDDLCKGLIRQIHKQKVTKLGSRKKLHICPKVTEMGSTIAQKIDYNGVGALRGQRHKTKKKITQVTPRVRIVFTNPLSFPNMRIIICEENIACNFMP